MSPPPAEGEGLSFRGLKTKVYKDQYLERPSWTWHLARLSRDLEAGAPLSLLFNPNRSWQKSPRASKLPFVSNLFSPSLFSSVLRSQQLLSRVFHYSRWSDQLQLFAECLGNPWHPLIEQPVIVLTVCSWRVIISILNTTLHKATASNAVNASINNKFSIVVEFIHVLLRFFMNNYWEALL